jgi:hypothetical protein
MPKGPVLAKVRLRNTTRARYVPRHGRRLYIAEYVNARSAATVARSLARIEGSRRDIIAAKKRCWRTVRGGSTSERGEEHLRARVRCFVNRQELPRIQAGYNSVPKCCDACGRSIMRGSLEYDVAFATMTFVLDSDCFGIWQEEMSPPEGQPA